MSDITDVDPRNPASRNSPIAGPVDAEATVVMQTAARSCFWNGQAYPEGARVRAEGVIYECNLGNWVRREE